MAADGKNAAFIFGATTYDSDDCLQSSSLNASVAEVVYFCSGVEKMVTGTKTITFSASMAMAASDTTKVAALDEGSTGAFTYFPGGNTAGYIKDTSTRATVTANNITATPNAVILMDVTFRLDDLTRGTAT